MKKLNPNPLLPDEEPFLIFANRYYLRKLNLDGSNYTLLKQVPKPRPALLPDCPGAVRLPTWARGHPHYSQLSPDCTVIPPLIQKCT